MYNTIMVPVDLSHVDRLTRSLDVGRDLARLYDAGICYVAVAPTAPTDIASSEDEFREKMEQFAAEQASTHGIRARARVLPSTDPVAEVNDLLVAAIPQVGADLVVMASHVPGIADHLHLMSSNAAYVVKHAEVSVFVVR
ncbi:universal stress protein [Marinobacter sp.]|uniref:universal stress protein n=1 Tax=Marinobacter sp. TaxID=50741 RepID=UPI0038515193